MFETFERLILKNVEAIKDVLVSFQNIFRMTL